MNSLHRSSLGFLNSLKAFSHCLVDLQHPAGSTLCSRFISRTLSSHQARRVITRTMTSAVSKRLSGKTVLITGASSGIGRSTAFEFARTSPSNLKLILAARRIDTLTEIKAEIEKEVGSGVQVLPIQLDVSKPEEVSSFVGKLPGGWKDIDVLVNNA
jgi:FlaA1/EpsC-like NDP-sugar epimerase